MKAFSNGWNFLRGLFPMIGTLALLCGCAAKKPGGRSDFWTTSSYAQDDVVYTGVGIRF